MAGLAELDRGQEGSNLWHVAVQASLGGRAKQRETQRQTQRVNVIEPSAETYSGCRSNKPRNLSEKATVWYYTCGLLI